METNDIVTKNFESYTDVAADIINALLYEGIQEIMREELLASPTESLYQDRESRLYNQLEDVAKYHMVNGHPKAMYLFANQTKVDKAMLLRKAGYVGGEYRRQYEKQNKGLYPVIQLVLYWGKSRWKGVESLHQLLGNEEGKIAETTWEYVDNMKLHVWEMRYLPKKVRELFQSDMRIILDYLAEGNDYRTDRKVIHKEATIKMLRVLSGDTNVEDTEAILKEMNITEEDEIGMCELFDQYTRRGREEGREEGVKAIIRICKDFNVNNHDAMNRIREAFHLSDTEAQDKMNLYW